MKATSSENSSPNSSLCIVICSFPNQEIVQQLSHHLIEKKLAACINILPGITSIYQWQGKIEQTLEVLLIIKTTVEQYPALETALKENHPYDCPEILTLPILGGSPEYLSWLRSSISS